MNVLEQFISVHDQMLDMLGKAYTSGDISKVRLSFYETYHGYFGTPGADKAEPYGAEEAIAGILKTGQAMPGVRQECTNRHVQMSGDNEAVVLYEKSMHYDSGVARAYVMEVWRRVNDSWKIVREVVETIR
ncbi:hypothetical protein [Alicyclobacillus sp. ALC3]|uniref:hypothetical protein n=1 Tax=Alicyclobacillus sp. ALC3 TaxID=2796143 RepID=UPI0023788D8D|nr:hypothetical protein [Alicyclobacillus sp. ALC3]WDL96699.1 hypothetical protein JC200_20730 [Alicyclobacillus sp. ALC3]